MQLQEHLESYRSAGLGVAAITYDTPAQQQAFIEKFGIEYPMLSDIDTRSFRTLEILNTDYEPGDYAYGIPHPGVFILDTTLMVRGKIFVQAYQQRVDAENTLAAALAALDAPAPASAQP